MVKYLMLMVKGRQRRGLILFVLLDICSSAELRSCDFSSTWTPLLSIPLFFTYLAPETLLCRLYAQMYCSTFPPHLSISFFFSCTSLPTSPSTVYRSVLSPSRSHLPAHHIHLTLSPPLYLPENFPPLLPVSPTLLLFLHTYKSHMEGLLLISPCLGLHLFCLSRDPTMQFPEPRTH